MADFIPDFSNFGQTVLQRRKELELTQAELAARAGVSQTTISRMEAADVVPQDIRLVSKVTKALELPLSDFFAPPPASAQEFFAFCQNPFCQTNECGADKARQPIVRWKSWDSYSAEEFEHINFCEMCGEELVKECARCQRRFQKCDSRFCGRCGERITKRPTEEEWGRIQRIYCAPPLPTSGEEDIPF